ncbi:MAG: YraN family protein [Patescibacteria group bacterium]|nr:YraN family protein [Patescibacteria group bacterium]
MRIVNPIARKGEDVAADYLKNHGYKLIERNFRKGYGEIDIVAVKGKTLVFVEVKTRTTDLFGGARESISGFKLRNLTKTAQFYSLLHPKLPEAMRIDAIFIEVNSKGKFNIEQIENISGF